MQEIVEYELTIPSTPPWTMPGKYEVVDKELNHKHIASTLPRHG